MCDLRRCDVRALCDYFIIICFCLNNVLQVPFEYVPPQQQESCKISFSGNCTVNIFLVIFL